MGVPVTEWKGINNYEYQIHISDTTFATYLYSILF